MAINPLDPSSVITATGVLGIFAALVAETGLLVGFLLPGDSLLFTAGRLAAGPGPAHLPAVRTVMNPMAGIIGVPWRVFTLWQILSGLAWTIGITLAGYWLSSQIPGIDTHLLPIIAVVVGAAIERNIL